MLYRGVTMYPVVERGTAVPPSRQIANVLRTRITSGVYVRGSLLPSILKLADEFGVTSTTVRKALDRKSVV